MYGVKVSYEDMAGRNDSIRINMAVEKIRFRRFVRPIPSAPDRQVHLRV